MQTAGSPLPLRFANLVYWLDASDPLNNGTQYADTANVNEWTDKSFTRKPQQQGTTMNQPNYGTASNRQMPSIIYDGSTSQMETLTNFTEVGGNSSFEIFIAGKQNPAGGDAYGIMVGWGTRGVNGESYSLSPESTNNSLFAGWFGDGPYANISGNTYQVHNVIRVGGGNTRTGNTILINNVSQTLLYVGGGALTPNVVADVLSTGAYNDLATFFADCNLQEILIYSAPLLSTERTEMYHYLANKWGL